MQLQKKNYFYFYLNIARSIFNVKSYSHNVREITWCDIFIATTKKCNLPFVETYISTSNFLKSFYFKGCPCSYVII